MRNTKQRRMVLDIINNSYNHPTAYDVYQECIEVIPNISLGTVYRNLNTLVSLGEIQRLEIPNQMTRYDRILCHDHFICIHCGIVHDVERNKIVYDDFINGDKIYTCKISYEGICCDCLNYIKEGDDSNGIKGK